MCAILVEMEETQFERAAPTKRIYQAWKGNNRFFFGGRLIFGPDVRAMFLTLSLILIPAVLFCAFIPQSAIYDCQQHPSSLVLAASTIFTVYILLLLLLTSGRDPGIIPRNACPPEPDEDVDTSCLTLDWIANMGTASTILPTKDVVVNGMVIKVKYCHTCMLYRPPRCSHCSICNNCVERFDHHCPWVGQCIGKRNYRIFFIFVASTTMFCLYVFGFCWLNISNITKAYHCNVWRALNKSPMSGILMVYAFIGAWFVGGLTAFHVYLICTNQTTYENFRYRYDRKTNPHNLGLIHNVSEIFFSKIPDSKANFRGKLKDHSSSAVNSSLSGGHCMRPERPKTGFDMDTSGDREDVAEEEFAALRNQMERVTSLERCGPQPRHANWYHGGNWEITTDIISSALAAEFGREHGLTARHKIG